MRKLFCVLILLFISNKSFSQTKPISENEWTKATKLWLARSCVGEAGFGAVDECMGIAWVYAVRSKELDTSLLKIIKKYSAPLKAKNPKRKWVMQLSLDGKRPKDWSAVLSWKRHKQYWFNLLSALDEWAEGLKENPVEGANHFGSIHDVTPKRWKQISPKSDLVFRNRFYSSNRI